MKNSAFVHLTKNKGVVKMYGFSFGMNRSKNLYYLNKVKIKKIQSHSLAVWRNILGHSNVQDILSLEQHVAGMKITGDKSLNFQ